MVVASAPEVSRASSSDAGKIAGRYVLLELLGSGGMGSVHRARDEATGKVVAFKQLTAKRTAGKQRAVQALFEREFHTLARLKHPRIIEAYDYGLSESGPFYTMELLDGADLQQLAPLPYRDACRYLRDVASSLALIHAQRLVHRDVSPRNVRLTQDGRAKLIDFGALAPFGPGADVVGTPVCMAPELLRRMPLDQRTDLYALGAVAYWALTRQHAFAARRFEDLPALWQRPPVAPSKLVPGIPPGLDALVLSLLSVDPLSRPSSSAAVIDQLTVHAELPPEEHDHTADAYLSSGRMVGRDEELRWVHHRVVRAIEGRGTELLIEGPTGVGKTRLMHEIALEAQLRGMVVLKADAQAAPGFFGVAAALASGLLSSCQELAREVAEPHAQLLAHLSPAVQEKLGQSELLALNFDSNERRARFQTALYQWFSNVADSQPLLLAVDNLHAADENSAAFLAALGLRARDTKLVVLATQRKGDAVVAKSALRALRRRSSRLKLGSLGATACEEFVLSLFGEVANSKRVAHVLYDKSAGNPQLCMDLAQLLVKKKIAKYVGGTWVLPLEVAADELPSRGEDILASKLDGLRDPARALAEALSVHQKPVPLELCLRAGLDHERETLAALDELIAEQILAVDGDRYRFAQVAVQRALAERMPKAHRRAQHARIAQALLAAGDETLPVRMDAAWHLLHAGEELRGANLLASTSIQFLKASGASESVEHLVAALRTAVDVYERHGRSKHEIAALLFPMIPLAYFSANFKLLQTYGLRAFELGFEITGLALAQRLRLVLGKKLALGLGMWLAGRRFARLQKRGLGLGLREAIAGLCGMVPAAMAAFSTSLDARGVARIHRAIAPLALFPAGSFPAAMSSWGEATSYAGSGRAFEARKGYEATLELFRGQTVRAVLGEGHFKSMYGGLLWAVAVMSTYGVKASALELATEMEGVGVRTWAMSADHIRLLYHAYRGEIEEVRRYRERVELYAAQGNATWQAELFLPAVLLNVDMLSGDTIAARRTAEQLARRAKDVPPLQAYADLAHAGYLALRGELHAALSAYERVLPEFPLAGRVLWLAVRGLFADALNQAGQHARAKAMLTEALALLDGEDDAVALSFEARRQLALAEAGLGHDAEAVRMLDEVLAQHGEQDNPLLIGLFHKARAELAIKLGDKPSYERHLSATELRFRATRNPALIAQCEQLIDAGVRSGLRESIEPALHGRSGRASTGQRTIDQLTAAADRGEYALWLILERSVAKSGYLYVLERDGLRLCAASTRRDPAPELDRELRELVAHAAASPQQSDEVATIVQNVDTSAVELLSARDCGAESTGDADDLLALSDDQDAPPRASLAGDRTVFVDSLPAPSRRSEHQLLLLRVTRGNERQVIGGVILELSAADLGRLPPDLLDAVANALGDRCTTTAAEPPTDLD